VQQKLLTGTAWKLSEGSEFKERGVSGMQKRSVNSVVQWSIVLNDFTLYTFGNSHGTFPPFVSAAGDTNNGRIRKRSATLGVIK
jgi:hypothetical protein